MDDSSVPFLDTWYYHMPSTKKASSNLSASETITLQNLSLNLLHAIISHGQYNVCDPEKYCWDQEKDGSDDGTPDIAWKRAERRQLDRFAVSRLSQNIT